MNALLTSLETSFARLFERQVSNLPVVHRIEIPIIQRDYAQGRAGGAVERIRANFRDALSVAVMPGGEAISLDFVYGDVKDGVLYPLDGQQRLTTLFLLHWYIAWRAGVPIQNQAWTKFSYATRPGARLFCQRLVEFQPPAGKTVGEKELSACLTDQTWYLATWLYDPTIQSMLVMLDALHQRLCGSSEEDCNAAWVRLTREQEPAIGFHLLPIAASGQTDDLYIKMNSRGKPLTAFENFKAHFEATLKNRHPQEADHFAKNVDTEWTDTLWHYRGADNLIDEEFMRYFRFVTEVCGWQDFKHDEKLSTDLLAERVYGTSIEHLKFLFQAFDTWNKKNIKTEFESLLASTQSGAGASLILFNVFKNAPIDTSPVDMFAACCRLYGKPEWSLAHTLILYAVLLSRIRNAVHFPRQLRIIRNLAEASVGNEIRREKMPELLADVTHIVVDGSMRDVTAFNQAQVSNENDKAALLVRHPTLQAALHKLEDDSLLRGCLAAFDLNPSISPSAFTQRADAFHALFDDPACWPDLTGALLAIGDYSRQENRFTGYRFSDFGASASKSEIPWQNLFKGKKEPRLVAVLMSLLDRVAAANDNLACLQAIQLDYLQRCATMDWRYYFVKYPAMREGVSGRYAISPTGYSICMLDKSRMHSDYRDPYLLAILCESGVSGTVAAPPWPWFSGYETESRQMILNSSRIQIRCVDQGWQITKPTADAVQTAAFDSVCAKHGIGQSDLCAVPQNDGIDTSDRVALGAQLLRDFVHVGL